MPPIGDLFISLDSVESTNNYAMAQVHAGMTNHGATYFTSHQTAGKGQRGKSWNTKAGESLAISIVIVPEPLLLSDLFLLSAAFTLGCYDLVNHNTTAGCSIKWPNDIYINDRKAGGVLIENLIHGYEWQYAIAGFGLNVNQTQFPGTLPNPVSLKQAEGKDYDIPSLAKSFCKFIEARLIQLKNRGDDRILAEYNAVLYKRNAVVKLRHRNIVFETMIKGVTRQGSLVTQNFIEQHFNWGEIEWVMRGL